MIKIDIRKSAPVYVQIMDQIRARILEGGVRPGTPLPSVRQLAGELELNANTVVKAYMLLEREGILRTRPRKGTYVAESAFQSASTAKDYRLKDLVDQLVVETEGLGIDKRELLEAVTRRIDEREPGPVDTTGGESR